VPFATPPAAMRAACCAAFNLAACGACCRAQVATRHAALEDAARKLDSEANLVKRRLAQANGALRMRGQKCARIERALESAREAEQAAYEQRTQVREQAGRHRYLGAWL